jgi:hypothetical protein
MSRSQSGKENVTATIHTQFQAVAHDSTHAAYGCRLVPRPSGAHAACSDLTGRLPFDPRSALIPVVLPASFKLITVRYDHRSILYRSISSFGCCLIPPFELSIRFRRSGSPCDPAPYTAEHGELVLLCEGLARGTGPQTLVASARVGKADRRPELGLRQVREGERDQHYFAG